MSKHDVCKAAVKNIVSMTEMTFELHRLRNVYNAAKRYMDIQYPCNCGELAPGPCCEECRAERELRDALLEEDVK